MTRNTPSAPPEAPHQAPARKSHREWLEDFIHYAAFKTAELCDTTKATEVEQRLNLFAQGLRSCFAHFKVPVKDVAQRSQDPALFKVSVFEFLDGAEPNDAIIARMRGMRDYARALLAHLREQDQKAGDTRITQTNQAAQETDGASDGGSEDVRAPENATDDFITG